MGQRRRGRVPIRFPITFEGEILDGKGEVVDLSRGGFRIHSHRGFKKPQYLRLILHPPEEDSPLKVELATVRWANGSEVGVEIIAMNAEHQKRLRSLIRFYDRVEELKFRD